MAHVLKIGNFVDVPLHLEILDGDKTLTFKFSLIAKRLSLQQWQDHFSPDGEHAKQPVREFLLGHITGWKNQTLVLDEETGQPSAFSLEAFTAMLDVVGVEPEVFTGYTRAVSRAATREGKTKN